MARCMPGRKPQRPFRSSCSLGWFDRQRLLSAWPLFVCVMTVAGKADAEWPPSRQATREDVARPDAWPNDPDYGFVSPEGASQTGQWELYSFIPGNVGSSNATSSREVAAGMSVDLAWRYTTGDPGVLVGILSTGIDWSEADLLDQVRLNAGELTAMPPQHADGTPCEEVVPGDGGVDCNDDGKLTIADYAEHPLIVPRDTDPPGDSNRNGYLDPQDLLRQPLIANGLDDDGNGYIDDVVGWDFVDMDNDPFDSAGAGLGTEQSLAAAANANNGVGGAGVCPECQVLVVRVAPGASADPMLVGHAIVYATDRGASVIALGAEPLGSTSLTRQAADYAWRNDALVIADAGVSSGRRASPPSTQNHVLALGAVTQSSGTATSTSTFLAASPCSSFGAQRTLSVPSRRCPADVVGLGAGAAALVRSAARGTELDEPGKQLTAAELWQVLVASADDVDVVESREDNATLAWSQPGFDEHFGYGRINVNRAVELVRTGAIPPAIDLTSPTWLATYFVDRVTEPVAVRGTIAAPRAPSYDYSVAWTPGVQPTEGAFGPPPVDKQGLPRSVVSGETESLAELDVRALDVDRNPDVDNAGAVDTTTITVRVQAVAHYDSPIGDVVAETRRTITVVEQDRDLLYGFPIALAGSVQGGPKLADIDGDAVRDVVVATSDGAIHVWSVASGEPTPVGSFPFRAQSVPTSYERGFAGDNGVAPELLRPGFPSAPAIGDVNHDGRPEIVATTLQGTVYLLDAGGTEIWHRQLPGVCSEGDSANEECPSPLAGLHPGALASPVLANLVGDEQLEIIQAGLDGRVHAYTSSGTNVVGWPLEIAAEEVPRAPLVSPPALADLTGDGLLDLILGTTAATGSTGAYLAFDGSGTRAEPSLLPSWPVEVVAWPLGLAVRGTPAPPAAGDFDQDGRLDVVLHGSVTPPWILPANPGGQLAPDQPPFEVLPLRNPITGARGIEYTGRFGAQSSADPNAPMFPWLGTPTLGDLDQDGTLDVVTSGTSRDLAEALVSGETVVGPGQFLLGFWSGRTGAMMPGSPAVISGSAWFGEAAIADIDGDDYPEMVIGTDGQQVHAVDACGSAAPRWPKTTGQSVTGAPAIGDIDGDAELEVVVATERGRVLAWNTKGRIDGVIAWESQHHDNHNTSSLGTPLSQGMLLRATQRLPLDSAGRCVPEGSEAEPPESEPRLIPSGGCQCSFGMANTHRWVVPLLLVALTLRRRRRGASDTPPGPLRGAANR